MTYIPAPKDKRLVWYLSMEEYLAQHVQEDLFFTWVVPPTVIFGRHQVMENEVNVPFCEAHGVQMYRRKSGGGCVYSDEGNLMLSYITADTHSEQVFQRYLDTMTEALRALGFAAAKSEHNDILIGDRKVSGNACYALPTGTIVHGTLLYDVNFEALQQAITPSAAKLAKHGVQSVRQRVTNLKSIATTTELGGKVLADGIDALAAFFAEYLCTSRRLLTPADIAAIDAIEQTYLAPAFIRG